MRRRLQADLERYLEHAAAADEPARAARAGARLRLRRAADERGEASELPALELGGGVRLRGRIDRVDVGAGGEAVVLRLQGRSRSARAPAGSGTAACRWRCTCARSRSCCELSVVGGFYQPLTGEDLRARGALDGDAGLELECMRSDVFEPRRAARAAGAGGRGRARGGRRGGAGRAAGAPADVRVPRRLHVPDDLPVRAMTSRCVDRGQR